ncbi:HAD family hydrolase [Pseudooceanicola sp. CBS1P-1]|uniref:HAD-IA family hydrolase n=1 Tax=Pseudooceanicola albus TaxID=2692189 RepID=A0A6L7G9I4_9RHOB|nr:MULTISPECIES: HAD family hydrolase [Pseudooceanicola]MBT9382888.1 HAD family hydrolase [Pseudooceanicola endophyticus]MXN20188.1 HAD-IA family hydrolase [Pseudooceanicola albus]
MTIAPPPQTPFDLVIFDCDGVLIDSEVISARMLVAELALRGIAIDLPYVARHFLGRSYPVVMQQIRQDFGVTLTADFEADYRNRLIAAFESELRIMPGVRAAIEGLRVPYMLATSSSPRRLESSLRIVGLSDLFAGRCVTASEVAHGKPAPDLFLHAAAKAGADPARCLVIEDSLPGLRAGLAAGMTTWQFTGGSHLKGLDLPLPDDIAPHHRFDDFNRFLDQPARCGQEA